MDVDSPVVKIEAEQNSMPYEGNDLSSMQSPPATTHVKENRPSQKTPKFIDKQPFQKLLDYLVRVNFHVGFFCKKKVFDRNDL